MTGSKRNERPRCARPVCHIVCCSIEDPDAIGVLARTAGEVAADLVVVGSHGRTGWRERILGNVATKLPHEVRCPVTIVPAPRSALNQLGSGESVGSSQSGSSSSEFGSSATAMGG